VRAHEGTARRYAKALHMMSAASGAAPAVGEELTRFAELLRAEPEANDVLTRPWIKPGDRRGIAVGLAERGGAGKLVRDFVGLVAERGRIDHLPEIVAAYRELVDQDLGQARAAVRTAVPLTEAERAGLGAQLERTLGKRVLIEERVDPGLLGGFVAQVGSYILDGSLDGQLGRMRERLARG
jgi:F-type H+-transporting ATPase subunit delta